MEIVCLDMEGTLTPEIWEKIALNTGIEEFNKTTRDIPDYSELMDFRLRIMEKNNLKLSDIQKASSELDLLPGAMNFLQKIRENFQVAILSDTFHEIAKPLMEKMGYPLLLCHNLEIDNDKVIEETDKQIETLRTQLNEIQEQSIQIRERKASSGATIEGLQKRKNDLLDRISSELNLNEDNILENSNLNGIEELPNPVDQEDALDKKKQEREKLGSVNLKADEETSKYEEEIKKMEQDRADLVTAIMKLKESINELNQKGRERLICLLYTSPSPRDRG